MGGSMEAFRVFYGRDANDPSKSAKKARETIKPQSEPTTDTTSPVSSTSAPIVRPMTPPIQADHTETHLEDDAATQVPKGTATSSGNGGITDHIMVGASALQQSISNLVPGTTTSNAVMSDVPSLPVSRSAERMERNTNEALIEQSTILSRLASEQNPSSGIATAADVEAGTALGEITPDGRKQTAGSV